MVRSYRYVTEVVAVPVHVARLAGIRRMASAGRLPRKAADAGEMVDVEAQDALFDAAVFRPGQVRCKCIEQGMPSRT